MTKGFANLSLLLALAVVVAPAEARIPATRPVSFDPAVINNPQTAKPIGPGAKGSAVVRAQILLDRAHYSCGEIDGEYGANLKKTVAAFQRSNDLPPSGMVDAQTWAVLNRDTAPALTNYTLAQADVAGPFYPIPTDLMEQADLPALGYSSPEELLGEKFHVNPRLLAALNPGKDLGKAGEQILAANTMTPAPGKAASVVVSKAESSVVALDAAGKVLAYYSATIGSEHDPLPIGDWKIRGVAHYPVFHYNADLFWDAHNPNEKAPIKAGPNNPVGVVWIDLNKEHYGIHGTPEPSKIGHTTSHGCIRLTNWDARELASMVQPGTPAILKE